MNETTFLVGPVGFFLLTLVFAVLVVATLWLFKDINTKLIVLGLVTAVVSIGYSWVTTITISEAMERGSPIGLQSIGSASLAGTMMKIAVVFVLTGVARILFAQSTRAVNDTPETTQGASDV